MLRIRKYLMWIVLLLSCALFLYVVVNQNYDWNVFYGEYYDDVYYYDESDYGEEDDGRMKYYVEEPISNDMARLERRMLFRKRWAEEACRKLKEDRYALPNGWEYLINYDHQIIWCNIFKAASTAWFTKFLHLAGVDLEDYPDETPVSVARIIYQRPSAEELVETHEKMHYTAFIIVRHPFERLSSAYRDKIQNAILSDSYGELAEEIVQEYRISPPSDDDKTVLQVSTPTFEEFVRYIIHQSTNGYTLDMHWIPYHQFCTPCQMHFDVIIKFETFDEDQEYLLNKTGISYHLKNPIGVENAGRDKRVESGKDTKELIRKHYSQLTHLQLQQLYQLYRYDFEIFNYTMDEYYDMVMDDGFGLHQNKRHKKLI